MEPRGWRAGVRVFACAIWSAITGILASAAAHAADGRPFTVQDVEVCPASADVVDPEFDPATGRMIFEDSTGRLRVVYLTPDGLSPDGACAGSVIDTNAIWRIPDLTFRQGPEWGHAVNGAQVYYTRTQPDGTYTLAHAWEDSAGWHTESLASGTDRSMPTASDDDTDPQPRIMYLRKMSNGKYLPYWREANQPETEAIVKGSGNPASGGVPRWVPGRRAISTAWADASGVKQAAIYNIDTKTGDVMTSNPTQKDEVWMWSAPEFGGESIFITVTDACCLEVWRNVGGAWTVIQRLEAPAFSGLAMVFSPEPFVWHGRSYVAMQVGNKKADSLSQIWIASVDPSQPMLRQVSDPSTSAVRCEPEWVVTSQGPFVYYTQYAGSKSSLRRAATGLD